MRKAYELDPKDSAAMDHLAESFEDLGQWDRALEIRKVYAAENPDSGRILLDLGWLYLHRGRIDDAIITYRKLLTLDPEAHFAITGLSDAYLSLGDVDRAIWWNDRNLEIQQDSSKGTGGSAWKFKLQGDDEAKEQTALERLKQYPRGRYLFYPDRSLLYHLTDLYVASGQLEELRAHWERAYPSFFEPQPRVDWIDVWQAKDLGRVLTATGEKEQANLLIEKAFALLSAVTADSWNLQLEVVLYAMLGDDQQTLDALGRFFDAGGSPYILELQDELKPILEHPEYQAMAEKRKDELTIQLERIREMEANGELPPIPEVTKN